MARSPAGLYFFLGVVGFLGFVFSLFGTFQVAFFLDFAYLVLPIFFLAVASTMITRDRESGFAGILFTHPVSAGQYYAAKFLALLLLMGLYMLSLLPFTLLTVAFAGSGWVIEILARMGWTVIITVFVASLGLLLSASLGRRATLPSVSLGFALALLLVFAPFLMIQYQGVFGPSAIDPLLALLHVSPYMGALDTFRSHGMTISEPLVPVFVSALLGVFLLATGLTIYRSLQSPEGWEARLTVRTGILVAVVAVLVLIPIVPSYEYRREPDQTQCGFVDDLEYCVGLSPGAGPHLVGTEVGGSISVFILNNAVPEPVVLPSVLLSWNSDWLRFNATSAEFTSIVVPADPDPDPMLGESIELSRPVRIFILRSSALGVTFSPSVPITIELDVNGKGFAARGNFPAVGPDYNRDTVWLVVVGMAAAAVGWRTASRSRRRKRD